VSAKPSPRAGVLGSVGSSSPYLQRRRRATKVTRKCRRTTAR
jgi:hypothetical protein